MQLWPLVFQAFPKVVYYLLDFELLKHVQGMDELIAQNQITEAAKRPKGTHSYQKDPGQVTHTLNVLNIRPIQLKQLKQSLNLA